MAPVMTKFCLIGGIDVPSDATPVTDCNGEVCAYKLADGSTVRLALMLEFEAPDGNGYTYRTAEADMASAGFTGLEYDNTSFSEL